MKTIKAPNSFTNSLRNVRHQRTIFLGGSIEMGTAENWQERIESELNDCNVLLLNPRRDDWDSSWIQSIDNPQFNEQVTWELEAQESANINIYYFSPNTKSPITLLELGLFKNKAVVCCPEGFWRKGNIDIICKKYNIPTFDTLDLLIDYLKEKCSYKQTSEIWNMYPFEPIVLDPDGWDRKNFQYLWYEEYHRRILESTCLRKR